MRKTKTLETAIVSAAAILLCLVLSSFWLLGNLYARYTTESTGEAGARVAAYVFSVGNGAESQTFQLDKIQKPGDSQHYEFSVTNQNGNRISEVAESYTVKAEINGSLPLVCSVKKTEEDNSNTEINIENSEGKKQATTAAIQIEASKPYSQTYQLDVTWPEKENDAKYSGANGMAVLTITVEAQQLD